ncbi:MAG: hypothetical protein HFJ54_03310 [Clostridia bacterium]|nr:hypothetical protein [Clostridia bacterium]
MKYTVKRIVENLVAVLIALMCFVGMTYFLLSAGEFAILQLVVIHNENEGKTTRETANGPQTWLPGDGEFYDKSVEARKNLVASNDIAKFLFDCGGSTTGEIVRILLCIMAVVVEVFAIRQGWCSAKAVFRGTRRVIRVKIHKLKENKKIPDSGSEDEDNNVQCTISECT